MQSWVALFRGINVGGHRKLPMKELAAGLEALGLRQVRTYIQSGNVVFRGDEGDGRALAERCLGVAATARNWRTVTKILELADGL